MSQATALGNQSKGLLSEESAELERHQRHSHEHVQEYQQCVRRYMSEVQQHLQVQQVASGEDVDNSVTSRSGAAPKFIRKSAVATSVRTIDASQSRSGNRKAGISKRGSFS